jgi:hypothetical protein
MRLAFFLSQLSNVCRAGASGQRKTGEQTIAGSREWLEAENGWKIRNR